MSDFITKNDYKPKIQDKRLEMIIEEDNTILDTAEGTAIAMVKDSLHAYYDVTDIFSKTGDARPKQVVRWVTNLVLYFIYERIPDKLVPERVTKNYDDTMMVLLEIADGKKLTNLPPLKDADDIVQTKFRWGSQDRRTY